MSEINVGINKNVRTVNASIERSSVVGPQGPPGEDGLSAYEIAVENGFIGSIEEWLKSLIGKQGEQGERGDPVAILYTGTIGNPVIASELPVGFCGLTGVIKSNSNGAIYTIDGKRYGIISRSSTITWFSSFHYDTWTRYSFSLNDDTEVDVHYLENLSILTTTGTQSISGLKIFNTLPQSSNMPIIDNQLTNKEYVDIQDAINSDAISGLQSEATAKWILLNTVDNRSRANENNFDNYLSNAGGTITGILIFKNSNNRYIQFKNNSDVIVSTIGSNADGSLIFSTIAGQTIYFRPNGDTNTDGQVTLDSNVMIVKNLRATQDLRAVGNGYIDKDLTVGGAINGVNIATINNNIVDIIELVNNNRQDIDEIKANIDGLANAIIAITGGI